MAKVDMKAGPDAERSAPDFIRQLETLLRLANERRIILKRLTAQWEEPDR